MGKMTMTAADLARLSPSALAQIQTQMTEQGSALPQPRMRRGGHGHHGHGDVPKVKLTPKIYACFGVYFLLMAIIAGVLIATMPA